MLARKFYAVESATALEQNLNATAVALNPIVIPSWAGKTEFVDVYEGRDLAGQWRLHYSLWHWWYNLCIVTSFLAYLSLGLLIGGRYLGWSSPTSPQGGAFTTKKTL